MGTEELAELLGIPKLPVYITRLNGELERCLTAGPPSLGEPALRIIKSGGKRLRPMLVIAIVAVNGRAVNDDVISAAAAIELVHTASLVHDDIIDRAKLRRGVPTISAKEGLNSAVLVGDYLLSVGYSQTAAVSKEIAHTVASAISVMCEGQALELTKAYKADSLSDIYTQTVRKKTGALISAACRIGGLCAKLPEADVEALASYGESFGIAFQIIDDILDKDFSKSSISKAVSEAKRYSALASRALGASANSSAATGLAELPHIYLNAALKLSGLPANA